MHEQPPHYKEALAAYERICELTLNPTSRDCALRLINFTLSSRRRIVLYLGAGCSLQVTADSVPYHEDYVPRQWVELLRKVFEKAPQDNRDTFLEAIGASLERKVADIDDLLPRFDRLQLAWFLTECYGGRANRDKSIGDIVEPARGAQRHSPFFEALFKLPFSDIITTNYDTNISYFFERCTAEELQEVASTKELRESLDGQRGRRIFYLHGIVERGELVFDRFDYAHMLEERDGLRDYVTFVMRGSHVVYLGFSLEDLSFNLLDAHLEMVSPEQRPECFAFLSKITPQERTRWGKRHLSIIEYTDHKQLPQLIASMDTVRRFLNWANPDNLDAADPTKVDNDRMTKSVQDSLDAYVIGDFAKSLVDSRAALATTLFWKRDPETRLFETNTFQRMARFVECRVRMALNHHKLRWVGRPAAASQGTHESHLADAEENLASAMDAIKALRKADPLTRQGRFVDILEHSVNSLYGRLKYHQGRYVEALDLYKNILTTQPNVKQLSEGNSQDPHLLWELKAAEGYYYAKCQMARITYQLRDTRQSDEKEDWEISKERIAGDLEELANQLRRILEPVEKSPNKSADLKYYKTSLRHILEIMLWTRGRYQTAVCEDVLPTAKERGNPAKIEALNSAIKSLTTFAASETGPEIIPPRWNAMRCRYLARAYGLRWLLAESQFRETGQKIGGYMGDLITAHSFLRDAFQQTRGSGLERQHIVNLLESARLTLIECFGERLHGKTRFAYSSPSMAACAHFLDHAAELIAQLEGEGEELRILALRIAAYFSVVARPWFQFNDKQVRTPSLRDFWSEQAVMERVRTEYKEFENRVGAGNPLETRIMNFVNSFTAIDSELRAKEVETKPRKNMKRSVRSER
jgi:tetratricopeptide (TPR) repeat protein